MKNDSMTEAQHARAELYETLALLGERLNVAKRVDDRVEDMKDDVRAYRKRNPVGFAIVVASIGVAVGAAVWAGTSALIKRKR